jgi:hypothetical protein
MNRATCGLQNSDSPTSDNVTPQETTNQDSPDMGREGASLSCPGSSVGADPEYDGVRFESSTDPETIGSDSTSSFQSQSLTEESETDEEPMNTRRKG